MQNKVQTILELIEARKFFQAKKLILQLKKNKFNTISIEKKFNKAISVHKSEMEKTLLNKLKKNIKEQNFSNLLKTQKQLNLLNFHSKKINKILEYGIKKFHKHELNQHKELLNDLSSKQNKLLQENKYQDCLDITYAFIKNNQWTKESHYDLQLLLEIKRQIIINKYKKNKKKIKEHTIVTQFEFIKKLYLIEPSFEFAQKLLYKYQKELARYDKLKHKIIIKEAKIALHVLFNQKKFETAIQKAKEFLNAQPNQDKILKFIAKCRKKIQIENYKLAYNKLKDKQIPNLTQS